MEALRVYIDFRGRPGGDRAGPAVAGAWVDPGFRPTRARRLVEHFGSIAAVFRGSFTELEATGLLAVSAQSLATGKSRELAQEEISQTTAAGVTVTSLDDALYPPRLKQICDPPLVLYVRGDLRMLSSPASQWWALAIPRRTVRAWPSV